MIIEHSLQYLRESLSNYLEEDTMSQHIYRKLENGNYDSENEFVVNLDEEEIDYLDAMLGREINYAETALDDVRVKELNDIHELLS